MNISVLKTVEREGSKINKKKVLVVDDDPNIMGMVQNLLDTGDVEFISFPLDKNLLKNIKEKRPDVILLDIMMPGIDGFTLCERMKSTKELKDIPIIFMSARDHISDKVKAMNCGGIDYIIKPFNPFALEEKIKNNLMG